MQNPIQQFVEKFFKNLNATISLENNSLKITNVPEAFQKYYGKKEPYLLTFEPNSNPEIEFIDKSNYLIQAISGYLDSSGKTTLLKIDFDVSRPDKILNLIKTPNASLGRANLLRKNSIFFRFTFHTVFQYLNEREKIINEIPLPIPRSVICSPSHIRNAVPAVKVKTVITRNDQPGIGTIEPPDGLFIASNPTAIPEL